MQRILTLFHQILGEFHDQNGVLAHQADRRQKTHLEVNVVVHAERVGEPQGPDHAAGHDEQHRNRHRPAFVQSRETQEDDEQRNRVEGRTLLAGLFFLVGNAVPRNFVADRQNARGDFADGLHGLTRSVARSGVALDVHGRETVEALQTRAAVFPADRREGRERNHFTLVVAHVPAKNVFRLHAGVDVALHPDFLDSTAVEEVVHVTARHRGGKRVIDGRNVETERGELRIVKADAHLGRIGHAVVAHLTQTGIRVGLPQEVVHDLHESGVSLTAAVLDEEVETVGHAEFRHGRKREDEGLTVLESGIHHQGRLHARHDRLVGLIFIGTLFPVLELQKAHGHIRARTRKREAAHREDRGKGLVLFRFLQERFDVAKRPVGSFHGRAVGQLRLHEKNALVFTRHEARGQLHETERHGADHDEVGGPHDELGIERMAHKTRHGVGEALETAVEPPEETALGGVLFMVDRLQDLRAEHRREGQSHHDGEHHGRNDRDRELTIDHARGTAEEGHRNEHGGKHHGDADQSALNLSHGLDRRVAR